MHQRFLSVVLLALLGCAQPQPQRAGTYLSPEALTACQAKGGRAEQARYALEVCALPTTDAGKACAGKSDCQGFCEAPPSAKPNAEVRGACSAWAQSVPTGCFNHVRDGKATGEWCFH